MDLRLLRYFLAIVDAGSVSSAALSVHVAQPSLSRQIRRLESELDLTLFDRSTKRLSLTAAGRAFLPVARDLISRAAQAQTAARNMAKSAVARLTVASSPTTIADIISPFIVAGGREGAIVNVVEASPENVYSVLQTGMADVAIGTRVPPSELNSVVIGHAYLWAQFPVGHPLSGQDRIEISDLMSWPLIVLTGDHGVRRMFDSAVAQHGLSYTSAFETESPHVAQALAAAGRGICILSDDSRFDLVSSPIGVEAGELTITLFGVWDPVHFASSRIVDCLESLRKFVSALYPQRM